MKRGIKFLACVALGVIAVLAFGLITMLLWNWLVPTLFGGPLVDIWQALGLLILSKILFSGFGGRKGCYPNHKMPSERHWKESFSSRFSSMTPEERAVLKQRMKEKWCRWDENITSKDSDGSND